MKAKLSAHRAALLLSLSCNSYFTDNAKGLLTKATLHRIDEQDQVKEQQEKLYQNDGKTDYLTSDVTDKATS